MDTCEQKLDPAPHVEADKCSWSTSHTALQKYEKCQWTFHLFTIKYDDEVSSLIWTILKHHGTYIGNICMIFAVCIGVYCFKRFWIRPAPPGHWPYSPVSLWHAIVDDDVDVAPIYRCRGKVERPVRLHRNHDLHIEWETERPESHCKQPALAKELLYPDYWPVKPKSKEWDRSNGLM